MYLGQLDDPPSELNTPRHYKIGDALSIPAASGTIDAIEWSATYKTWCYRLVGRKPPYWVYQKTNNDVPPMFNVVADKLIRQHGKTNYAYIEEQRIREESIARRTFRPPATPPKPLPPPRSSTE